MASGRLRLLTVGSLPPELGGGSARGGVATFHAALLDGIGRRREEVEVVGVLAPDTVAPGPGLPALSRPDGVGTASFYEGALSSLEPDVVLMNHFAHTIGVTHARLPGAPPAAGIAHSWHNLTFAAPEEAARRREVAEEALGGLEALVTGSRHSLLEGRELGLRYPGRTEVIHYPLAPHLLEPAIEVGARRREGVLFLGSLIPRKNPEALVDAVAALPGLGLTLAGEGELEGLLRERIAALGVGGRIALEGHLPAPSHLGRVRELLLGAEVMCVPSSSESFGLVYIEALACGTPVVGFGPAVREIRERLGVEIGEPLDDPSPESISWAVEKTIGSSWDRAALRRAATAAFDLESTTARYVDLLRDCRR